MLRWGCWADGPKVEYGGGCLAASTMIGGRRRESMVLRLMRKRTGLRKIAGTM